MAVLTVLNETLEFTTSGNAAAAIKCTANTNVTAIFEATSDGTNWAPIFGVTPTGALEAGFGSSKLGFWVVSCAGIVKLRVRVTAVGGTPTATVAIDGHELADEVATRLRRGTLFFALATFLKTGLTGIITAVAGILNFLGLVRFNATKPALLDGQMTETQGTGRGAMLVALDEMPQAQDDEWRILWAHDRPLSNTKAGDVVLIDQSAADEASSVTKASPGRLYGFVFHNGNAAARYIQFFNSTTVPADTAVPSGYCELVPAGASIFRWFPQGIPFTTGIAWCNSTSRPTKTLGAADSFASVFYM